MAKTTEMVEVTVSSLKPYERNAKKHPEDQIEKLKDGTQKGMIVLDAFGGSGTTLIAAEQLGRKCRMVELDPHYCDVIINRWETLTGEKAVLING